MDEFEVLAAKVLAGEATSQEKARLNELFAQDANLRDQFAELELARDFVREIGPLAQALDAPPAAIPEHRLRALQKVVTQNFGSQPRPESATVALGHIIWSWCSRHKAALAACVVAVMACALWFLVQSKPERADARLASQTIGYFIVKQGQPEIRRRG